MAIATKTRGFAVDLLQIQRRPNPDTTANCGAAERGRSHLACSWNTCLRLTRDENKANGDGETGAQEEGCGCRSHTSAWVFCCRASRLAPLRVPMSRPARQNSRNARSAILRRQERTRSGLACSESWAAKLPAWIISITRKP